MQETQVLSLGQEDPPEEEMAIPPSILAWEIPWTHEPGGRQSMGSQSQQDLADWAPTKGLSSALEQQRCSSYLCRFTVWVRIHVLPVTRCESGQAI